MDSGIWNVNVAAPGSYNFTLRRWPEESGLGISDIAPIMQGIDGMWPEGKALPVASAWLKAGNIKKTSNVDPSATSQIFQIPLDIGHTSIKSWWYDKNNTTLAGAYYITVERVP